MSKQAAVNDFEVNPIAFLGGTVKEGNIGPPVGLLDIGVSESAYIFRIALPGILKDPNGLKCEVHHSGRVQVQADMVGLAAVKDLPPSPFRLITPVLSSPGPFMVSFNLPGPVDGRLFTPIARQDGILEVVIMKSKRPGASEEAV